MEMKSKFVSIASHEFRTPLSTISLASGFVKKFKNKMTGEDLDKKLVTIETQVKHMSSLLDDILTIGKADAGKIEVNWVSLPVRTFFENLALEVVESARRSHRINMKIDYSAENFRTDEGLIRNVVINLLNNAIKFSQKSDEVDFEITGNDSRLIISVRDHGIGIPTEDVEKLFQPFYRGGNVATISGTGLGLSIVKKAIDLLGGDITMKSELGKGAEFTITLPSP